MVSEALRMRSFVVKQLCECPDLSTLTQRKIRELYSAHRRVDSLSHEDTQLLKRIVEEELLKVEDGDSSDDEPLSEKPISMCSRNLKRKCEVEEKAAGRRVEDVGKKRLRVNRKDPDSPDSGTERVRKATSVKEEAPADTESDEEESSMVAKTERQAEASKSTVKRVVAQRRRKVTKRRLDEVVVDSEEDVWKKPSVKKQRVVVVDSEDEDATEHTSEDSDKEEQTEKKRGKSNWGSTQLESEEEEKHPEMKNKGSGLPRCPRSSSGRGGDFNTEIEGSGGAGENGGRGSAPQTVEVRAEEETKVGPGGLSDSSSLPSFEEGVRGTAKSQQVKKKMKALEGTGCVRERKAEENRMVSKLKRYIALCGVRRNYKKLLDGCRSVKSQVAVLKRELEELGVVGQPSVEKCKKARLKREEAEELAELDVANIITTQGRTRRRTASQWPPAQASACPEPPYKRALGSDSDSEEDVQPDWSNLQGIITDGGESE